MAKAKRKRRTTPVRRRKSLSDGSHAVRRRRPMADHHKKMNTQAALKMAVHAAAGGAAYEPVDRLVKKPMPKAMVAGALGIGAAMVGLPFVGAGMIGAASRDVFKNILDKALGLHDDGDMKDYTYVDPSTLTDYGLEDGNGRKVFCDHNGDLFVKQGNGVSHIGHASQLGDNRFALHDSRFALHDSYGQESMINSY